MKVIFDSQAFRLEHRGGISRYIARLGVSLFAMGANVEVVAPIHRNLHLLEARGLPAYGWFRAQPLFHPRIERVVNRTLESRAMSRRAADVFHPTFYWPTISPKAAARVLTVHDMIHERFRHWHPSNVLLEQKANAVRAADHIICISEHTRRDLCELLNVPMEATTVVYHGGAMMPIPATVKLPDEPYLLFVGQRHRHKNFSVILDAYGEMPALRSELSLVLFGGRPPSADEWAHARRCGLNPSRIIHVTGDDATLAAYYARAQALIYPSLYEGFGMPLLEAMSLACPIITSNSSCMPEIAGSAALYFDPESAPDLARRIVEVMEPELRRRLVGAGRHREREFSWDRCAAETLNVYSRVLDR